MDSVGVLLTSQPELSINDAFAIFWARQLAQVLGADSPLPVLSDATEPDEQAARRDECQWLGFKDCNLEFPEPKSDHQPRFVTVTGAELLSGEPIVDFVREHELTYLVISWQSDNTLARLISLLSETLDPIPKIRRLPELLPPPVGRTFFLSLKTPAIRTYRDQGCFPESILHYFALVSEGIAPSRWVLPEIAAAWNLEQSGELLMFDETYILELNARALSAASVEDLISYLLAMNPELEQLDHRGILGLLVEHVKSKCSTLGDLHSACAGFFYDPQSFVASGVMRYFTAATAALFEAILPSVKYLRDTTLEDSERYFILLLRRNRIQLKEIAQPLRLALTGQLHGPSIFLIMFYLGKTAVERRLRRALDCIEALTDSNPSTEPRVEVVLDEVAQLYHVTWLTV